MNSIMGREVKAERKWVPNEAGDKNEFTSHVFYSGDANSDEHIIGDSKGIFRTTDVDVSVQNGRWPSNHSSLNN